MGIRRREFLRGLAGAAVAVPVLRPHVAAAQQSKVPRVALLSIDMIQELFQGFYDGLGDYGYVDGKNIVVQRFTAPTVSDIPKVAVMAVATRPDIIWTSGTPSSVAAKNATATIPIVFATVSDPVGVGLVSNLAHPGGNITGNSNSSPELEGKKVAILKEIMPQLTRLAVMVVPSDPQASVVVPRVQAAAAALGIQSILIEIDDTRDFAIQFSRILDAAAQAVYTPPFGYFNQDIVRDLYFDLLVSNRLPAIGGSVANGAKTPFYAMVSYAASLPLLNRQSAAIIDAILKGVKPGDLPVQLPTVFDLAVNMDTARKIGITIPPSILAQATLVVDEDWRAPKAAAK